MLLLATSFLHFGAISRKPVQHIHFPPCQTKFFFFALDHSVLGSTKVEKDAYSWNVFCSSLHFTRLFIFKYNLTVDHCRNLQKGLHRPQYVGPWVDRAKLEVHILIWQRSVHKKAQNISSRSNIQCLTSCLKQPGCNVARVAPNGCEKGSKAVKLNSDMGGVQAYKQRDHSTLSKSFSTFICLVSK